MENNIEQMLLQCKEAINKLSVDGMFNAELEIFIPFMCMLFDTYSANHTDCNASEIAQTVADLVREVNNSLGAYVIE